MKDKKYTISNILIIAGAVIGVIGFSLLMFVDYMFFVLLTGIIILVVGCVMKSKYKKSLKQQQATEKHRETQPPAQKQDSQNDLDPLMSAQLIAYYKENYDKKYMNEYIRRLQTIGFTKDEAFNLFSTESMNMKHDSVELLKRPDYTTANYFDLKHKLLPFENEYYIKNRTFTLTEITKIWDEAEWLYHNAHEENMPDDVWNEIFMLTRYGSGELIVKTLEDLSKRSNISFAKITAFSAKEQDMLFKYKWNVKANEPHPYY